MKKRERENKSMINRLTKDLKREQDRNLHEVSLCAHLKREVSVKKQRGEAVWMQYFVSTFLTFSEFLGALYYKLEY